MNNSKIQTSDLYLAAVLLAYGSSLVNIDREKPERQVFVFEDLPKSIWVLSATGNEVRSQPPLSLEEIRALKLSNRLLYPPNYVDAIHSVKSCIYSD